ncbi:MAG TPA: hypothetical protein VGO80_09315 [Solirubrobacteraceae bacterium]|jgi:hypothetical protein|nr:hypothetical protein [Solirubrobacteraceae bacterium]
MYEEFDACQLAALKTILTILGSPDGSIAWSLIQAELPHRWDERPLILLFDPQDKQATLACRAEDVAAALPDARPIIAVRLDDPIARAGRAFRLAANVA